MRTSLTSSCLMLCCSCANSNLQAQVSALDACPRPTIGSMVPEPEDLRSRDGVLTVNLTVRNQKQKDGSTRYCYTYGDGIESPNLRLKPGDLLILKLKNDLIDLEQAGPERAGPAPSATRHNGKNNTVSKSDPCSGGEMNATSANLHFHGLTIPSVCHQDEVLKTSVRPSDPPFEYRFRIPENEPPGLYWYHPHIHGFSKVQVLGGASGALIVEGIERANSDLAGLPERVMIIRDQDLLNPDSPPSKSEPVVPKTLIDRDGDSANNGTGFGKPAKDLSLNFVPVPYPDYPPAVITMKPGERQLWRVLNASAITYLNLQVIYGSQAQAVGLVAVDGIPLGEQSGGRGRAVRQNHLGIPPGGRIEFEVTGPAEGVRASLVTRSVNTGPGGENDPTRPLATIVAKANAPEPRSRLTEAPAPLPRGTLAWLGSVTPVRTRKLYFSEVLQDPQDPNSPTTFFLTVDGQTPKAFDMSSDVPNIVAHQGDVEDWIIENRSQELHAFHIHQVHFLLLEFFGLAVNEQILRDTVNVPYWDGKNPTYPRVKLRVDFRDPNAIGLFPYHCHLLEHEDSGMMGLIRVDPRTQSHEDDGARSSKAIPAVK